jgi:hypothetical protein
MKLCICTKHMNLFSPMNTGKLLSFTASRSRYSRSTTSTSSSTSSSFRWLALDLPWSLSLRRNLRNHAIFLLLLWFSTSPSSLLLRRASLFRCLAFRNETSKLFILPHPGSLLIPPLLELLLSLDFLHTPCCGSFLDDILILLLLQNFL